MQLCLKKLIPPPEVEHSSWKILGRRSFPFGFAAFLFRGKKLLVLRPVPPTGFSGNWSLCYTKQPHNISNVGGAHFPNDTSSGKPLQSADLAPLAPLCSHSTPASWEFLYMGLHEGVLGGRHLALNKKKLKRAMDNRGWAYGWYGLIWDICIWGWLTLILQTNQSHLPLHINSTTLFSLVKKHILQTSFAPPLLRLLEVNPVGIALIAHPASNVLAVFGSFHQSQGIWVACYINHPFNAPKNGALQVLKSTKTSI